MDQRDSGSAADKNAVDAQSSTANERQRDAVQTGSVKSFESLVKTSERLREQIDELSVAIHEHLRTLEAAQDRSSVREAEPPADQQHRAPKDTQEED